MSRFRRIRILDLIGFNFCVPALKLLLASAGNGLHTDDRLPSPQAGTTKVAEDRTAASAGGSGRCGNTPIPLPRPRRPRTCLARMTKGEFPRSANNTLLLLVTARHNDELAEAMPLTGTSPVPPPLNRGHLPPPTVSSSPSFFPSNSHPQ
jgi:hypothetical protein